MNRILIIGGSILQLPAIKKAKEMGLYVGVVDFNPNAIGRKYADEFFEISTIDIDGVTTAAKKFLPQGVITLATDMPMRTVAAVAKTIGLKGISPEIAYRATDKVAMIKCFEDNNVPHPWYYEVRDENYWHFLINELTYPCIIKPADSSGSRGVCLLNNKQEASQVYSYAKSHSSSGVVIVEEYMKGPEVSVEIIVYENEIHIISITDKMTTGAPHFVELGHKQPSALSEKVKKDIAQVAIKAVKAIGINNSAAHVEIIVTDNGPKLVELGARLGGDCITSHLVPLSTGIDMVKASIDLAMGHKPDLNKTIEKVSMIKYIPSTKGILKNIKGIDQAREIPGIKEVTITKQIGEEVGNIKNSGDRLGYIIVQASSYQEAEEIFSNALTKIIVEVENDENII